MEGIDRFHWNLARAFFGISCVWAILGICCNSVILITTIKTKSMRSTYNILIAICAAGDIFHQAGNLVQLPLLLNIHLEVDSHICVFIMFLPEMGIAIGCTCIFCIGFDRMISVMFTMRYRTLNKRYYHAFLASLISGYCMYLTFLMTYFHQERTMMCEVVTPFLGKGFIFFTFGNFTVNSLSAVVYFITWIGLKSHSDSTVMKRIVKSLFIIVAVDVSGWFLTPGLIMLLQFLKLEGQEMFAWTYCCTIFIHVALSVKLFIYYGTSSEYHAAIDAIIFRKTNYFKNSISIASKLSAV